MKDRRIIIASTITALLLTIITIAFAALSANLNISFGNVTQNALTWNVGFKGSESIPTSDGTSDSGLSCGTAIVTPSTVTVSDSTLSKPGDKCTYPLVIENKGDISATLSSIATTQPTSVSCTKENDSTMVCGNITYMLRTINGNPIETGITINPSEEYNIKLIVSYTGDNINSTAVTQTNAKFTLTYVQSSNRSSSDVPEGITAPVCKRATTLHTEECAEGEESFYCGAEGYSSTGTKGTSTITYGSLGTKGTLTSGDAFDCDVDGDGIYSETERFYYVSGIDGDDTSNYAVLVYYTNVTGGVADSNSWAKYSNGLNRSGPTVAYQELPSTTQWSNVSLSNQKRQLYTETGTALSTFTYTDKAARLLSVTEVNKACNITVSISGSNSLTSCEYFMENAHYSRNTDSTFYWWLETPLSNDSYRMWIMAGDARKVRYDNNTTSPSGVRPAIEVPLSDIAY